MHLPIQPRKKFDKTLDTRADRLQNDGMAITEIRTDDLNDDPDAVAVEFSYKGVDYTIDLGPANQGEFDTAMKDYIVGAHVVKSAGRPRTTGARKPSTGSNSDAGVIREWALANGFPEVPKRGRINADIREAYEKAQANK